MHQRRSRFIVRIGALAAGVVLLPLMSPATASSAAIRHHVAVTLPSWHKAKLPMPSVPADPGAPMGPISCWAAGDCESLGAMFTSTGARVPVVYTETAGSWAAAAINRPDGTGTQFEPVGIQCSAAGDCVADGYAAPPQENEIGHVVLFQQQAGAWSGQLAPVPGGVPGLQSPTAPSCAGGTCSVVADTGTLSDVAGLTETDGHWSARRIGTPDPRNDLSEISDLACPSATSCVAVGALAARKSVKGLILTRDGRTWSAAVAPDALSGKEAELTAVACTAPGQCEALGSAGGKTVALEILTDDGGTWSASPAPKAPGARKGSEALAESVACPAAGSCVASAEDLSITISVKTFSVKISSTPYVLEQKGDTWNNQRTRLPEGAPAVTIGELGQISCSSAGNCAVAGEVEPSSGPVSFLVEDEVDGRWSGVESGEGPAVVEPAIERSVRSAVDRTEARLGKVASAARQVGSRPLAAPQALAPATALAAATDRTAVARAARRAALPSLRRTVLRPSDRPASPSVVQPSATTDDISSAIGSVLGTSCSSDGGCSVAAFTLDKWGNSSPTAFGVTAEGDVSTIAVPLATDDTFADQAKTLTDEACSSATRCTVVGISENELSGTELPYVARWNGQTWSAADLVLPASFGGGGLVSVVCPGDTCTAIGETTSISSTSFAVTFTEHGSHTTILSGSSGTGIDVLSIAPSIACSTTHCLAAFSSLTSGALQFYWEVGGHWTEEQGSTPSGKNEYVVTGVACPTGDDCLATVASVESGASLIDVGSGSTWRHVDAPAVSGVLDPLLTAISCRSDADCTAVGEGEEGGSELLSWNGTRASAVAAPVPPGGSAADVGLDALGCGRKRCVAGGFSGNDPALAVGHGSSWSAKVLKSTSPAFVTALGCSQSGFCAAAVFPERGAGYSAVSDDGAWQELPLPGKALEWDISCPATDRCLALGEGLDSAFVDTLS